MSDQARERAEPVRVYEVTTREAEKCAAMVAALRANVRHLLAEKERLEGREHPSVRECREDGALCALCEGGAYPPWLTDDATWRSVMGDSQQQVCLPCFFDRARTGDPLRVALAGDAATPDPDDVADVLTDMQFPDYSEQKAGDAATEKQTP